MRLLLPPVQARGQIYVARTVILRQKREGQPARAIRHTHQRRAGNAKRVAQLNQQLHAEQERLDYAKQTALNFISVVERDIQGHLGLLETLKTRDLTKESAPAQPEPAHERPYDWQADRTEPVTAPVPSEDAEKIATEISDNLEKLIGSEPEAKPAPAPAPAKSASRPMHPESATIKFEDLKFGRNYDPTSSK